jgi:chromosome segregation ATPase
MVKDMEMNAGKMAEVNEALVNANKQMEDMNAKMSKMEEELNASKSEYNAIKEEKMKMETNTYFENEIKRNNFAEAELNSLKEYVAKGDINGLKQAEIELCAKKFKEMTKTNNEDEQEIELNNRDFFVMTKKIETIDPNNTFDITQ